VDIGFGEAGVADGTLAVAHRGGVLDAFFAENVRAGLQHHFALTIRTAAAQYFGLARLQLLLHHLILRLRTQLAQLVDLQVLLLFELQQLRHHIVLLLQLSPQLLHHPLLLLPLQSQTLARLPFAQLVLLELLFQ
jgi:hypothetical protein